MTEDAEAMRAKCEALLRKEADVYRQAAAHPRESEPQWCLDAEHLINLLADDVAAIALGNDE